MAAQQGRAGGDAHAVDIASLALQLREELSAANSSSSVAQIDGSCPIIIAAVGSLTRNVASSEYDPHHVAIGPYHRNRGLAGDDVKIRCLDVVLSAASASTRTTLEVYLQELADLEDRVRGCYAHFFPDMASNDFVRMLLLDGCYLLVRFRAVEAPYGAPVANGVGGGAPAARAPGCKSSLEAVAVVRDVLYLAENQIPFFVVNKIHQLTFLDGAVSPAVDTMARYVRDVLRGQGYSENTPALTTEPGNLLHLLHMHLKPTTVQYSSPAVVKAAGRAISRWRTATEYLFAGVRFKRRPLREDGARCILDVKVDGGGGGVLEVPRLNIDAETWRLLRNLIAMEQHNPETAESHVTAYCVFMSQLACTARDVELLSRRGVIVHGLGNHGEVATLFSDLCKGVVLPECNYLRATCQTLEKRFGSRRLRWMAWLLQEYFRNPWLAIGLAGSAVLLVCTVVQAVFSVLAYK